MSFDLGPDGQCTQCRQRLCLCEERQPDGSWKAKSPYSHILRQAAEIADQRSGMYGDVIQNLEDVSANCKALYGMELSAIDIAKVMIACKFARQKHLHNPDNLLDTINYTAILLLLIQNANLIRSVAGIEPEKCPQCWYIGDKCVCGLLKPRTEV